MLTVDQFYDKVYQIKATEGVQILIPPKFLGELRGLPEDTLSATEAVSEVSVASGNWFISSVVLRADSSRP